ncbi:probable terpene synthase 11 [Vigna umbellata]|uniref:probable terpene synthase 11 n=1 Tax=Vigna umbellata TaxID=87088 RepID=UPI001F5E8BC2|nr:probable terpene synthase 11 [Vigna umbellata]
MSSTITMAITQPRVSSFTSRFAYRSSQPLMNQLRNLSCKTSTPYIMKLSINSIALPPKVPTQTIPTMTSLEQLKIKSQEVLLDSSDSLRTLKLIDTIQRLGIDHHFEEEINLQLGRVADCNNAQDLFATALQFRLLRHNGWSTSSDVFNKFLDKSGNFKESVTGDVWGMLSLHEASYLGSEGEEVLQHAMEYSRAHLHQSLPHLSPEVGRVVVEALKLPRHQRMVRLEAKNYTVQYSKESSQIPALLELARLDYDMVQSMHQKELAEISRWWKDLGLIERLGFGRDGPRECFLWALGIFPEPRHSNCRIELAKAICILQVIDDMFDTYGTLDDLILFTEAVQRWDLDAMEKLPEYMKICYMALYNTTHEIAYRIQRDHGQTVVSSLKRTWIDLLEAYLKEAKWFNNKYVPAFGEYLDNGVISSGSCLALVHATVLIGENLSRETISMMSPYPRLFTCSGEILRLWDDLGTSKEEQERGDNACSIQCLMKENDILDESFARKHIRRLLGNLWPELNGLAMATTTLPSAVTKASFNMARTSQFIYQHGDDQQMPTVDDLVQALLFTPSDQYREESDINCVV